MRVFCLLSACVFSMGLCLSNAQARGISTFHFTVSASDDHPTEVSAPQPTKGNATFPTNARCNVKGARMKADALHVDDHVIEVDLPEGATKVHHIPLLHATDDVVAAAVRFSDTDQNKHWDVLYGVERATGTVLWTYTSETLFLYCWAVDDAHVLFTDYAANVKHLDLRTGHINAYGRWDSNPVHATPLAHTLWLIKDQQRLTALDVDTGEVAWTQPAKGKAAVVVLDQAFLDVEVDRRQLDNTFAVQTTITLVWRESATGHEIRRVPIHTFEQFHDMVRVTLHVDAAGTVYLSASYIILD